jgi:hypothetical protein
MREDLRSESNWLFELITARCSDMMGSLRQLSLTGYDGVADTVNQPGSLDYLPNLNVEPLQ